jgi:hypothetical protein
VPQGCPAALMPRLSLVTSSKPLSLPERHPSATLVRYPGRWDAIQDSRLRAQAESPATGQRHPRWPLSSPLRMSSGVAPRWPSARGRKHRHTSPSYLSFPSRLLHSCCSASPDITPNRSQIRCVLPVEPNGRLSTSPFPYCTTTIGFLFAAPFCRVTIYHA